MDAWILCYIYEDEKGRYGQAHWRAFTDWRAAEAARAGMVDPSRYWVCKVQLPAQP